MRIRGSGTLFISVGHYIYRREWDCLNISHSVPLYISEGAEFYLYQWYTFFAGWDSIHISGTVYI